MVERSADTGRTGAALQTGDALLFRLTGRSGAHELEGTRLQTWTAVHAHLRVAVERDPNVTIHDRVAAYAPRCARAFAKLTPASIGISEFS